MQDQSIQDFLASLGYEGESLSPAYQVLVEAGLTRPGKVRIARRKRRDAEAMLRRRFVRACGNQACQAKAARACANNQQVATVNRELCDICGGSENARAVQAMGQAMMDAGKTRLLVIGGTPNMESELSRLMPPTCKVRFVLEGVNRAAKDAKQEAGWAHTIVIWASTPIAHKTSELYKPYRPITVSRRGIAALADEVTLSLTQGLRGDSPTRPQGQRGQ